MPDFKTRLIEEKEQLNERIEKLESFVGSDKFSSISAVQQSLLNVQLQSMRTYSQVLVERIAWVE